MPGYLEFFAGGGSHDLDATMTNVSHSVRDLSFVDPPPESSGFLNVLGDIGRAVMAHGLLPMDIRKHMNPMQGMKFGTEAAHQTWEHHLIVVSTLVKSQVHYQFSHYNRIATALPEIV